MGLDMYLTAEKYIGVWNHSEPKEKELGKKIIELLGEGEILDPGSPALEVSLNIGCWRKANAIHGWFVRNLGDGQDECQKMYVSKDYMESLLSTCKTIVKENNKESAFSMLPPTDGFFFGNTDDFDYFMEDVKQTIPILEKAIGLRDKSYSIYYQASW